MLPPQTLDFEAEATLDLDEKSATQGCCNSCTLLVCFMSWKTGHKIPRAAAG